MVRTLLPVATLFIGKLIIDEVLRLAGIPDAPGSLREWLSSGLVNGLFWLLILEFALAVLSDVLGRFVSLFDALLSEQFTNATSIRLMEHAATLDLEDFEDSELQDRLERAQRQTIGRMVLMSQLFDRAQDIVTIISFAAGLMIYAPWLILLLALALVPAFFGEAHFNEQSYSLAYARTPERREQPHANAIGISKLSASASMPAWTRRAAGLVTRIRIPLMALRYSVTIDRAGIGWGGKSCTTSVVVASTCLWNQHRSTTMIAQIVMVIPSPLL